MKRHQDRPGVPESPVPNTVPTIPLPPGTGRSGSDLQAVERLLQRVLVPEPERLSFGAEVGSGGMGRVELVTDRALERRMACKVLRPDLRDRIRPVAWFLREAQITAQLDHPAITPIHQIGLDPGGRLHFTMKLIEGETFEDLVQGLGPSPRDWQTTFEILEVVVKVSDALAFAHSRGVVHCDVKPSNVMVAGFGQVYVMDWGLARTVATRQSPAHDAVTTSIEDDTENQVAGTPAYMAPEQARGEAIDERIDVFAVGALLYFALTLRRPYQADSVDESWALARGGQPAPVEEVAASGSVPSELARIVGRAMRADPAERYPSMTELRSDLTRFMRGGTGFPQRRVQAGELILREGDPADAAFVLVAGRALIFKTIEGTRRPLRELAAGEVFGEMAILTESARTASVEALEDCLLTVVSRDVFEREVDAMQPWMGAFARTLAARFRELEDRTFGAGDVV